MGHADRSPQSTILEEDADRFALAHPRMRARGKPQQPERLQSDPMEQDRMAALPPCRGPRAKPHSSRAHFRPLTPKRQPARLATQPR